MKNEDVKQLKGAFIRSLEEAGESCEEFLDREDNEHQEVVAQRRKRSVRAMDTASIFLLVDSVLVVGLLCGITIVLWRNYYPWTDFFAFVGLVLMLGILGGPCYFALKSFFLHAFGWDETVKDYEEGYMDGIRYQKRLESLKSKSDND